MALAALVSAVDTFRSAPVMPKLEAARPESGAAVEAKAQIARQTNEYVESVTKWRWGMQQMQRDLWAAFEGLRQLPIEGTEILPALDSFVELVDQTIIASRAVIADAEAGLTATLKEMQLTAAAFVPFARAQLRKLVEAAKDEHNVRVEFYYFLLALRAEHDPEARGAPAFDNPDDLKAYLDHAAQ